MAKQPVKKKVINLDFLNNLKAELKENVAYKPYTFIELGSGFQQAVKLPGIPEGELTIVHGHSNTGKSSIINEAIVGAQKKGIMPVIIDTENHFSFQYAKAFGMDCEPQYGTVVKEQIDTETGEIHEIEVEEIVNWEGNFVFYNQASLLKKFGHIDHSTGKTTKSRRALPCIEDVALCIKELLDAQDQGLIPYDMLFVWDSVGSIHSYDSLMSSSQQNMRNANKLKEAFSTIIPRITATRNQSSEHLNSAIFVNKVWNDNMAMGMPTQELWGGEGLKYLSRFMFRLGGVSKASVTMLNATCKGELFNYGIETKVCVTKNQLDSPWTISVKDAKMACVVNGIIPLEKEEEWKKDNLKTIVEGLKALLAQSGKEEDFNESEISYESEVFEGE